MGNNKSYINYFLQQIRDLLKNYTPEYIGNNLNDFIDSDKIDEELKKFISVKDARKIRASLDQRRGKLFEEITKFLLNESLKNDKNYNHIKVETLTACPDNIKEIVNKIKLCRKNLKVYKTPDIDLIVYSEKYDDRIILLSVKGTSRERIGQYLSNIFIFDKKVMKEKYGDLYYLDKDLPNFKISFICFDLAKQKDFSFENKIKAEKARERSQKQIEVYLIDDDPNVGYGIFVFNNLHKLHKVGNFSSLLAKLKEFFNY